MSPFRRRPISTLAPVFITIFLLTDTQQSSAQLPFSDTSSLSLSASLSISVSASALDRFLFLSSSPITSIKATTSSAVYSSTQVVKTTLPAIPDLMPSVSAQSSSQALINTISVAQNGTPSASAVNSSLINTTSATQNVTPSVSAINSSQAVINTTSAVQNVTPSVSAINSSQAVINTTSAPQNVTPIVFAANSSLINTTTAPQIVTPTVFSASLSQAVISTTSAPQIVTPTVFSASLSQAVISTTSAPQNVTPTVFAANSSLINTTSAPQNVTPTVFAANSSLINTTSAPQIVTPTVFSASLSQAVISTTSAPQNVTPTVFAANSSLINTTSAPQNVTPTVFAANSSLINTTSAPQIVTPTVFSASLSQAVISTTSAPQIVTPTVFSASLSQAVISTTSAPQNVTPTVFAANSSLINTTSAPQNVTPTVFAANSSLINTTSAPQIVTPTVFSASLSQAVISTTSAPQNVTPTVFAANSSLINTTSAPQNVTPTVFAANSSLINTTSAPQIVTPTVFSASLSQAVISTPSALQNVTPTVFAANSSLINTTSAPQNVTPTVFAANSSLINTTSAPEIVTPTVFSASLSQAVISTTSAPQIVIPTVFSASLSQAVISTTSAPQNVTPTVFAANSSLINTTSAPQNVTPTVFAANSSLINTTSAPQIVTPTVFSASLSQAVISTTSAPQIVTPTVFSASLSQAVISTTSAPQNVTPTVFAANSSLINTTSAPQNVTPTVFAANSSLINTTSAPEIVTPTVFSASLSQAVISTTSAPQNVTPTVFAANSSLINTTSAPQNVTPTVFAANSSLINTTSAPQIVTPTVFSASLSQAVISTTSAPQIVTPTVFSASLSQAVISTTSAPQNVTPAVFAANSSLINTTSAPQNVTPTVFAANSSLTNTTSAPQIVTPTVFSASLSQAVISTTSAPQNVTPTVFAANSSLINTTSAPQNVTPTVFAANSSLINTTSAPQIVTPTVFSASLSQAVISTTSASQNVTSSFSVFDATLASNSVAYVINSTRAPTSSVSADVIHLPTTAVTNVAPSSSPINSTQATIILAAANYSSQVLTPSISLFKSSQAAVTSVASSSYTQVFISTSSHLLRASSSQSAFVQATTSLTSKKSYQSSMTYIHPASTATIATISSAIPDLMPFTTPPTIASAPFQLNFRWKDITFDLQFINASSSQYKDFVAFTERQLIKYLAPFVTAANVIFLRSGSVEVSVALTIRTDRDVPLLEQELENRNRSGLLGNHTWIASFWGSQDLSCLPPKVHLQNLPSLNNKGPAVAILRSNDFIVQGNVINASCNSSNTLLFRWFLTSYSVNEAGETKIKGTTLLDATGTQWNLPKRLLNHGTYYVDFRAAFASNPKKFGSTLGFFRIEKSPLRAVISGGNTVTRGKGKTITLNGSLSQDPDVETGDITSMNFTWLCKKRLESFPTSLPGSIPVVSLTSGPGHGGGGGGGGGCFGTGVGRLSSNTAVVNLPTSAMNVNEFYDIKLIVQKDTRDDEFVQEIKIVNGNPPEVTIRCIINCGETATNARISLTTSITCAGGKCKNPSYQWLLASIHPPGNKEKAITLTRSMTETELNLPGIIIKKDALEGNVTYRLKVNVTQAHGPPGISSYQFRMNVPPEGGQCTVKPLNGSALKTLFNIQCSGWKDDEKPLTYEFHYKTGGGLYTVVSYGSEDHVGTVLPQGPKNNNLTIEFSVTIRDKLFAETTVQLDIIVEPPPANESLSDLALGNSSVFNDLVKLGDVRGATQLANAVLQTAQESETIAKEEETKIKSFLVKQVSNVEVRNLQALTQVTSVLARATLEPEQVTVDTQALALQSLSSLTSLLRNKTKDSSESTLVEQGGENLLLSIGNILNSAAQKASVIGKAKLSKDVRAKSEGVSVAAEKLIDDVGTTLLSRMVVDQEPHKVKTPSLDMVLNRLSPRSLKTNREHVQDNVGFKLPFEAITDERAKDAQFVDSLLTLSAFNPFTWDSTSASVKSHVLSLVLKDQDGKVLKVENSKKEVELKIKRDPRPEPKDAKESFFAKPSDNGKMRYHKIDLPDATGHAVRLRIKPTGSTVFKVFVRHGQRPTLTEYDAEKKVPDGSCSLNSRTRCDDAAYDFLLVDSVLAKPGSYYIGILYDKSEQERIRKRKRRSCFGRRRHKRSCVEFKELPKPENITLIPVYDPKTDANYSLNAEEEECLFWNRKVEKWQSNGCKVGSNSTTTSLQCLCNHLTSFGGGVLVMPNKLVFDVVFTELTILHETGNVAVLCTVIAALLLYFLICVFARRADKKDRAKTGPPLHLNSTLEEGFQYQLTIVTGVWKNSGTDANVTIVIHGSDTDSQPIVLNRNMMESRIILARGNEDQFVIHLPAALGEVQYVRIWHDNSGKTPSWFLSYLTIKDLQTESTLTFPCNSWLALEKGDGKIDRLLSPISYEETQTFMYSLNSRGSQSFSEGHMWLSVVTKPPKSTFTRVQRITCCLCLLMSAMLVNALFYRTDKEADPTIQIGPLKFSWRQVVVGLQSALIVTPVNLLIVAIFKNTAEKRYNRVMPSALRGNRASAQGRVRVVSCWGGATETKCETEEKECCSTQGKTSIWKRTIQRAKLMTKDFLFPHCFLYIAWFLSFLTVASSATFTIFFSLQWGKDISNEWLSSMLVSFSEDLFVLQPIKIVLIMFIAAYFFGFKSESKKVDLSIQSEHPSYVNATGDASQSMKMQPPNENEIEQARRYRVKEAKMFSFSRELFLYMLFLTLLAIVCYGNRSYHGYLITNNLQDTYLNFPMAQDPSSYWNWLRGEFVNGIYANEWYNGKKATKQEYINNKKSILLGMPRLRQMRIKKDACKVPEVARASIKHCYDYYSIDEEEKNPHNLPGWEPFRGSSNWANFSNLCPAPWNYVPQEKLHGSPSWGFFDIYSGGGYVADLGYNKSTASPLIDNLQKYGWIDRQTRAVVLEFVVYNTNTGYLSISSFYYEILPIGCGHPFAIIDTFPLTSTQTGFYEFFLICQLLFIILVIFFVLREAYAIYQLRCSYFRDPWNFVEIFQITFSFLVVVLYVVKSKAVLNSTLKVKENPFVSVSFRDAVVWNDVENMMLAITVFIATIKMLRMIRFNRHIGILMSSFRESGGLLLSYSIIFIIVFSAYAQLGMLVLGSQVREYSSFSNALVTEFLMSLGNTMSLHDLTQVNRVLGPLFGFSFALLNAFIFVNFFVAILNDTHAVVKHNTDKQSVDDEMADFIFERFREFLGFRKNPLYDSSREREDNKQELEMKGMTRTAFSSVAFQAHQLRLKARKIQLRNAEKSKENTRKENKRKKKKRQKNRLKEERADSSDVNQTATEESKHNFKSTDTAIASLIPLNETTVLSRLGTLTSQVARDDVSEDIEMLSLIRLIRCMEDSEKEQEEATDVEDTMSEREAQLDDIEVVSYVTTPNPSRTASPNTYDDISGHSVCSEELNQETTQLLRQLNAARRLPEHLTGKQVQQNLRAALRKQSIPNRPRWRQ